MSEINKKKLFLAVGSQSGGTTLVSWCFLQHSELDGELDMACDKIRTEFDLVETKSVWVKMTNACFRYSEVSELYQALGYEVIPLLVVRNPFHSYASLKNKWYGRNAITAEDPPLILRFSRFVEDWRLFKKNNWPIIKFESFISDPKKELQLACKQMGLTFEDSMIEWPKSLDKIAYVNETNSTFGSSMSGKKQIINDSTERELQLSIDEKNWLEQKCSEILIEYDYACPKLSDCDDTITPKPFDGRRFVGYGNKGQLSLSSRVKESLTVVKEQGRCLHIYGAGEFGWYLYKQAKEYGIAVKSILDSDPNKVFLEFSDKSISCNLNQLAPEDTILIGSLGSKKEIIEYLLKNGVQSNLISF